MRTTFFVWGPRNGFGGFYFRIRGYGLSVQRDVPAMFSERNGYRKVLRIGRWAVEWLRPARRIRSSLGKPDAHS